MDAAGVAVELESTGLERTHLRCLAAKLNLNPGNQLADEERLYNVVVSAEFQADNAVGFGGARGEENHRNMRQLGVPPNRFADFQAIGIRQHYVQNDQVRPLPAAEFQRPFARLRSGEYIPLFFEVVL